MSRTIIYVSPHLDDAVLSCAGRLRAQVLGGDRVIVATPTAADPAQMNITPLAREIHARFGLGDSAISERRKEDERACLRLGAAVRHGPFLEAVYRLDRATGSPLYGDLRTLFGRVHPAHKANMAELVAWLRTLPEAAEVVAPLAVGYHVDHEWTRSACEACFPIDRLLYYEDYPYAQRFGAVSRVVRPRWFWRLERFSMNVGARRVKCDAIADYASQAWTIFQDRADMERKVRRFLWRRGGERYWKRLR
jgi:LmbE family N-acetylglucosaminyl deacetylase